MPSIWLNDLRVRKVRLGTEVFPIEGHDLADFSVNIEMNILASDTSEAIEIAAKQGADLQDRIVALLFARPKPDWKWRRRIIKPSMSQIR